MAIFPLSRKVTESNGVLRSEDFTGMLQRHTGEYVVMKTCVDESTSMCTMHTTHGYSHNNWWTPAELVSPSTTGERL